MIKQTCSCGKSFMVVRSSMRSQCDNCAKAEHQAKKALRLRQ